MKCSFPRALFVCAFAGVVALHVHDPQADHSSPDHAPPVQTAPIYTPLTLQQKYLFAMNNMIGAPALSLVLLKATFDHVADSPGKWGSDEGAFAVRYASRFGRSFVRQNLAFGVRALDGEDPRYFVSGHGSGWTRTRYAIGHTFVAKNDRGNWMPAYAMLVSNFGMPFIANEWRPDRHSVPREFRMGGVAVGFATGSSLWQEFWPDLRKKVWKKSPTPGVCRTWLCAGMG